MRVKLRGVVAEDEQVVRAAGDEIAIPDEPLRPVAQDVDQARPPSRKLRAACGCQVAQLRGVLAEHLAMVEGEQDI